MLTRLFQNHVARAATGAFRLVVKLCTVLTYPCSTIRMRQSHRGSAFQGRALERGWPPGGGAKTPEAHLRLVPRLLFSRRFDELGGHVVGQPDSIVGDKEYETRAMHVAGSNG